PDGFDPQQPVTRDQGGSKAPIRGSACLIYFLGTTLVKEYQEGEDVRRKPMGPFLEIKGDMISGDATTDLDVRIADPRSERIDPWGNPNPYDRTEIDAKSGKPKVDDQSPPSVHTMKNFVADKMHGPDPRKKAGSGKVETKNAGSYDLWSHGSDPTDPTRAI